MRAFLLLAGLALLAGCSAKSDKPRFNAAKAVDAIRADEVRWNADWKSGDAGKIVSHFASDAVVMEPGAPPMTGAEAIRAGLAQAISDPAFALSFTSDKVEVAASGDLAASHGTFTETSTDPATKAPTTINGSFVTVYKPQADGSWKAVWDIGTANPAAKPATP